jgi:hypothetical protein
MTARVQLQNRKPKTKNKQTDSGHDPQGAWSQDELIGGKPPIVK